MFSHSCLINTAFCHSVMNFIFAPGKSCSEPCPQGTFGPQCRGRCDGCDPDKQICDHVTGECICKPGKRGQGCAKGNNIALADLWDNLSYCGRS